MTEWLILRYCLRVWEKHKHVVYFCDFKYKKKNIKQTKPLLVAALAWTNIEQCTSECFHFYLVHTETSFNSKFRVMALCGLRFHNEVRLFYIGRCSEPLEYVPTDSVTVHLAGTTVLHIWRLKESCLFNFSTGDNSHEVKHEWNLHTFIKLKYICDLVFLLGHTHTVEIHTSASMTNN